MGTSLNLITILKAVRRNLILANCPSILFELDHAIPLTIWRVKRKMDKFGFILSAQGWVGSRIR